METLIHLRNSENNYYRTHENVLLNFDMSNCDTIQREKKVCGQYPIVNI